MIKMYRNDYVDKKNLTIFVVYNNVLVQCSYKHVAFSLQPALPIP